MESKLTFCWRPFRPRIFVVRTPSRERLGFVLPGFQPVARILTLTPMGEVPSLSSRITMLFRLRKTVRVSEVTRYPAARKGLLAPPVLPARYPQ